jgi:hypothetical protein
LYKRQQLSKNKTAPINVPKTIKVFYESIVCAFLAHLNFMEDLFMSNVPKYPTIGPYGSYDFTKKKEKPKEGGSETEKASKEIPHHQKFSVGDLGFPVDYGTHANTADFAGTIPPEKK